jgi:hypothetical protein
VVAIGFGDLQGLQVPREQRAIKVTLALQVQQGRSAQQAQKVPRDLLDLLDLLDLGGPRGLLVLLEIQQRPPGASNFARSWWILLGVAMQHTQPATERMDRSLGQT